MPLRPIEIVRPVEGVLSSGGGTPFLHSSVVLYVGTLLHTQRCKIWILSPIHHALRSFRAQIGLTPVGDMGPEAPSLSAQTAPSAKDPPPSGSMQDRTFPPRGGSTHGRRLGRTSGTPPRWSLQCAS